MNLIFRKRPLGFGDFIASVYDIFFHTNRDYQGGADADHIPVIPGNDFAHDVPLGDNAVATSPLEKEEKTS